MISGHYKSTNNYIETPHFDPDVFSLDVGDYKVFVAADLYLIAYG
jgi:hypothetical protein